MISKTVSLQRQILKDLLAKGAREGDRLSTIRQLADKYKVSYVTAQKAVKSLQEKNILNCRQGAGIYVKNISGFDEFKNLSTDIFHSWDILAGKKTETKSIGIVLPEWVKGYGGLAIHEIIRSITRYSDDHPWHIELIDSTEEESAKPEFLDKIAVRDLEGIVWLQPLPANEMNLMRLIDHGYEVLVTGRKFHRLPLTVVWADIRDIAENIADYAVSHGKKNPIIMSNAMNMDDYCKEYIEKLRGSFEKRNLKITDGDIYSYPNKFDDLSERERLEYEYLKKHPDTDLIILLQDYFYSSITKCIKEGIFKNLDNLEIMDIPAEYCHERKNVEGIPIKKIKHPFENIGKAVVRHFEECWLNKDKIKDNKIDLKVKIK